MKIDTAKKTANVYGSDSPVWQLWCDGASDLAQCWDLPPSPEGQRQRNIQRKALGKHSGFYGVPDEPTARGILLGTGWHEGAELVAKIAETVKDKLPPPASRRRKRYYAEDYGTEYNTERAEQGRNPWLNYKRKIKHSTGLIELVVEWGQGCGATLDQLKYSGAAALALTDLMERADYSVELALVAGINGRNQNTGAYGLMLVRVDLKQMGQVMDVQKLAAIAVHPAVWRVYGLAAFQQGPWSDGDGFDAHHHAPMRTYNADSVGMWGYRPNVMTLKLEGCTSFEKAVTNVREALVQLDHLVNPIPTEEF